MLSATALLATMGSCKDDAYPVGSGEGLINPLVEINSDIVTAKKTGSREAMAITVNDLALKLTSADGSVNLTWPSIAEFDVDKQFKVGGYTMEASYGALEDEGFEKPYYYGAAQLTVVENKTTPVALTAKLANSMVKIDYTDAFKGYFTAYDLQLHSEGGAYIDYMADETRAAYLRPGKVTIIANVTKPNGVKASLEAASFVAQAQHQYTVTIDVNDGQAGEAQLVISFDELLDQEDIIIDLSDELMSTPAPEVTVEGFDPATTYELVEGTTLPFAAKFNVIARGQISSATLTTESKSLEEQGWPTEIDLCAATAAQQARLKNLGIDARGFFGNVDKMAVLDLSNVVTNIKYREGGNNAVKFTLVVKDKLGKVTEPVSLSLDCQPVVLSLANPSDVYEGDSEMSVDVVYNGADIENNVKIQYKNERGTWSDATISSITPMGRAASSYRAKINIAADDNDVVIRAAFGSRYSDELTVKRLTAPFGVTGSDNDVFAKHALVTVTGETESPSAIIAKAKLMISTDGVNFSEATTTKSGDSMLDIKNLEPSTAYTVKLIADGLTSRAHSFTTEAATDVPNGDFEDLATTITANEIKQGGEWSISVGVNYQSHSTYEIKEPVNWASVNKKTTSGTNQNTWFSVPSTFNSSLSWSSTVPAIKVVGTGGGTETPDSYKGFAVKSGSNAMVVRNVAWDANGTTPSLWRKSFISSDEHYNHNVPTIASKSAGKLFLGSYTYNGADQFNEGVSFASRPSALKGYYYYTTNDNSEQGVVTVSLMNGDKVIATSTTKLAAAADYAEFSLPLTYPIGSLKATSLRIMISSSDKTDESQISVDTFNYRYESAQHGATLVVDNLSFTY